MKQIGSFLGSGITLGFAAAIAVVLWALAGLGGWEYYTTPLAVRAYSPMHASLRPSGPVGQTLGLVGATLILMPFVYMLRKRMRRGSPARLRTWLEVHLFCGIVGPVLVTLHTSFKFNGIVSAAYWSMVIVMLSGFMGRYLYVRIPRSLRGIELTRTELESQAAALAGELASHAGGRALALAESICAGAAPAGGQVPSWLGLLFGELPLRRRLRRFSQAVSVAGLTPADRDAVIRITTERVFLLRRLTYLERTKAAFALWHVFHLPLVYVLLVIVALHVGVVTYLGYVPFRW
jgi:hypothetical protein